MRCVFINNNDNIVKKKKQQPSKARHVVKSIFFVNYKILSYIINVLLTILLVGIITTGICVAALLFYVTNFIDDEMPTLDIVSTEQDLTTTIWRFEYDCRFERTNPRPVVLDTLHGVENRMWVRYNDTPEHLRMAFVALEDHRFYQHNGVDWRRTAAAVRQYIFPDGRDFGASTITQQVVKMLTGDDDVTVGRKIQEIMRALNLDSQHSKQQILEVYMNTVFLSNGQYGVQAAANFYFGKDVSELTLLESVALASIVQAPTVMNPLRRADRNQDRRDQGLRIMLREGWITQEEFDGAYNQELILNRGERTPEETIKSYFVDQVIEDVMRAFMELGYPRAAASQIVFSGGLNIYTTIDYHIQSVMEYVYIYNHEQFFPPQPAGAVPIQSAMVVMNPRNGNILGVVGGRGDKVARGLNRATQSRRQPGSAIKPVSVYGPAIEFGHMTWGTPLDDTPFMLLNRNMWPVNLPRGTDGFISPVAAMAISKNTTAVRMLDRLTPEISFRFMYHDLNMKSLVEREVRPNGRVLTDVALAPLALGGLTHGITVLELTAGFGAFAADGIFTVPRTFTRITDQTGSVVIENAPERRIVVSEETAFIMTRLMQTVMTHPQGTGRSLRMRNRIEVAGKTGTTNEERDRWFVGYTPHLLAGVWMGYDDPRRLGVRGSPAMNLWNDVMEYIHQPVFDNPELMRRFEMPPGIVQAHYCRDSGMAPGENCRLDLRGNRISANPGYFARGNAPTPSEPCNVHVLVDWCTLTNRVAGPGCPRDSIRQVALVREERRAWERQVWVGDAQYMWRDVPDDYIWPSDPNVPFFINTVPPGVFAGAASNPANGFCVWHNEAMTLPVHLRPEIIEPIDEDDPDEDADPPEGESEAPEPSEEPDNQETEPGTTEDPPTDTNGANDTGETGGTEEEEAGTDTEEQSPPITWEELIEGADFTGD